MCAAYLTDGRRTFFTLSKSSPRTIICPHRNSFRETASFTMIRALIFDFDGLILDTEMPAFQAWQELYAEQGCSLSIVEWADHIGTAMDAFDPCGELETRLERPLDCEAIRLKYRQREHELLDGQVVLPGVEDYLADARCLRLKLAIASSSDCAWVTGHLARLGLRHHFDAIKGAEDVEKAKPDPDLYLAALDALKTPAHQAVALEDSPNGVRAAQAAGLFCVAVPNMLTRLLDLHHADLVLPSLANMPLENLLAEVETRLQG
jgi:HAD superfamily hydrolase (TIGR01509 family)